MGFRTMSAVQFSSSRLRSGPSGCGFVSGWDDLKLGEERDARFTERIQGWVGRNPHLSKSTHPPKESAALWNIYTRSSCPV
jgi:hypothetical protein